MRESQRKNWIKLSNKWLNVETGLTLVPIRGGGAAAFDSLAYRVRNDDGTLATATWHTAQDTPATVDTGIKFRVRHTLDEYVSKVGSVTPNIYYNYNGGGWVEMTTTSTYLRLVSSDYAITDGDPCSTERLDNSGAGNGVFDTAYGEFDDEGASASILIGAKGNYIETEHCMEWVTGDVTDTHTCLIRIYDDTSTLGSYTNELTLTVALGVTNTDLEGVGPITQSNLVEHIDLVQVHNLQVEDLSQANLVEHISIAQESTLVISNLSQSNFVDTLYIQIGLLAYIDMEEGDLTDWDTFGHPEDLSATLGSALAGSYGMEVYISDTSPTFTSKTLPEVRDKIGVRFLIDTNNFVIPDTDAMYIAMPVSPEGGIGYISLRHFSGSYQIRASIVFDLPGTSWTSYYTLPDGKNSIEVLWSQATGDAEDNGYVSLWLNGALKETKAGVDSYTRWGTGLDELRLGMTYTVDTFDSTLYYDDIILRDDGQYIGTEYELEVNDLSQANSIEFITGMTEQSELTIAPLSQSNLVEHINLAVIHHLAVDDLSQSNLIEHIDLTQESTLVVSNLSQVNSVTVPSLTQVHNISVDDLAQSNSVDELYIQIGELFHITHDDGTLDEYDALIGSEDLDANANAAMAGTSNGMEVTIDDLDSHYGQIDLEPSVHSGVYGARFYLDPNSLTMDEGEWIYIFNGYASSVVVMILLRKMSGNYTARIGTNNDTPSQQWGNHIPINDGENCIEGLWVKASSPDAEDGYMTLWINGAFIETISDIDGYDGWDGGVWRVQLGTNNTQDVAGSYYLDELIARDDGQYIGTIYALEVADLSQSNLIEHVTLSTEGAVAGFNLSQTNLVLPVVLTQVHNLTVNDLSQANTVDEVAINTASTLTISDLSVNNVVGIVTLVQIHNLSVDNLAQSNLISQFGITQQHILSVADLSQANLVEKVAINTASSVVVSDLSTSNLIEKVSLAQLHILSVENLLQSNLVEKVDLQQQSTLIVNNLSQANSIEHITTTKESALAVDNLAQVNFVSYADLTQLHILSVYDLSQSNTVTHIVLSTAGTIVPFALAQSNSVEAVSLTQVHNLGADNITQSSIIEHIGITQQHNVTVADISQTSIIDFLDIAVTHILEVDNLGQVNVVDVASIIHQLFVDNLAQGNLIQEVTLVKNLALSNLFQANVVEFVLWGASLDIHNLSQTNTTWNSSFWQEQFEWAVTITYDTEVEASIERAFQGESFIVQSQSNPVTITYDFDKVDVNI